MSNNVIDINGKPSPEYVRGDEFKFACKYRFGDRYIALDIWAKNVEEAEEHIEALRNTLEYQGQLWCSC